MSHSVQRAEEAYKIDLPDAPKNFQERGKFVIFLGQIANAFEAKATFVPPPQTADEGRLTAPGLPKSEAIRIIRLGYLAPYGPVVTGKKPLTPAELGDALSFALVRGGTSLNAPSEEFTPLLMP